jgi:NitT/TauT family transport system permease protein
LRTRSDPGALILPALLGAALLALWHLAVVASGTHVVPGPLQVLRGLIELGRRGLLWRYALASLGRVAAGYGIGLVIGIPLGMWIGLSRAADTVVNPLIQLLRPISPIAWIPIAIVLFGIGDGAPVFLIALAALFPIVSATAAGVRRLPPMFLQAGRNFGLGPAALLQRVVFPAALPQVLVSLRIALGICWLVVVAAEMIAVDSGLGYLIIDARNAGKRYDLVVAGMVMVGGIGLALDLLFRRLERLRSVRWGFRAVS